MATVATAAVPGQELDQAAHGVEVGAVADAAAAGLAAIATSTLGGFGFMTAPTGAVLLFEAFVAGALTHVLIGHSNRAGCSHG